MSPFLCPLCELSSHIHSLCQTAEHLTGDCGYPSPFHWLVTMSSTEKRSSKTLCGSAPVSYTLSLFPEEHFPGWSEENKGCVELTWMWPPSGSRTSPGCSQVCKKTNECLLLEVSAILRFCSDLVSVGIPMLLHLTSLWTRTCRSVPSVTSNLCLNLRVYLPVKSPWFSNQSQWPSQKALPWKYSSFELGSEIHKIFYYFKKH